MTVLHALHAPRPISSCQADTGTNFEPLLADCEPSLTGPLPPWRDPEPPWIDSLTNRQASQATNKKLSSAQEGKLRKLVFRTYPHVTMPLNNRFLVCSYRKLENFHS